MKLQTKFILSMAAMFLAMSGLAGWCMHRLQDEQFAFTGASKTATVTVAAVQAAQSELARKATVWIGLLLMSSLIVVHLAAKWFVCMPIERMGRHLRRIADEQAYGTELPLGHHDEMSAIATAFNQVLAAVRENVGELRDAKDNLERRVAERTAEIVRSSAELQAIHDTSLDGIISMDESGRISGFNPAAERIFKVRAEQAIGAEMMSLLVPPSLRERHRQALANFLAGGEGMVIGRRVEVPALRGDGSRFSAELAINAFAIDGHSTFVAFIRDITDRKRAQEDLSRAKDAAEAASRAKSQFLANMSHEIRTPLNGVIGMIELLEKTGLSPSQQRFAQTALESARTLLGLINDILDFSKIEAGRMELVQVSFDLNQVFEEVMAMLAPRAEQRKLELTYQVAPEVPLALRGDPERLRQVVINLATNAIKFTEKGEVAIRASLEPAAVAEDEAVIRIEVTDTGIGIPRERAHRLFQSFSQVDASTTRKYGGTGLGLAICRQLVGLMGGRIGVRSRAGKGSTFWFTARLRRQPTTVASRHVPGDLRGLRVLAVDDNATHGEILEQLLSSWGFQATCAADAQAAKRLLDEASEAGTPFSLAVIDMLMPGTHGLELGQAIRADDRHKRLPMVLLTPLQGPVDEQRLRQAGFSAYVSKPVRQSHLFDAIVETLAGLAPQSGQGEGAAASSGWARLRQAAKRSITGGRSEERMTVHARVLLAEDNEINQMVASEVLMQAGHDCKIVGDGKRAVEAAMAGDYDVVLMDCQMPEMDGFEATQTIRRKEAQAGGGRHVPIIALTANAIQGDRERCLAAGMDDYMSKPLDGAVLVAKVSAIAARRRGERSAPAAETAGASVPSQAVANSAAAVCAVPAVASSESSGAVPIEWETLFERCMADVGFVEKMLGKFREQSIENLQQLKQSIQDGKVEEGTRIAHSIKGAAAYLSAGGVQQAAAKLEQMGRAGSLANAQEQLDALSAEVQRCIEYIPQLLASKGRGDGAGGKASVARAGAGIEVRQ